MLFKERALEAKRCQDGSIGKEDIAYQMGYLMAFHEIIDAMKQQAQMFDIEQKDIGLEDIDSESDLL